MKVERRLDLQAVKEAAGEDAPSSVTATLGAWREGAWGKGTVLLECVANLRNSAQSEK